MTTLPSYSVCLLLPALPLSSRSLSFALLGSPQMGRFLNGALGPHREINLGMPCTSSRALEGSWVGHQVGSPSFEGWLCRGRTIIPALCSCTCRTTDVVANMLNPLFFCVGVQMVMMFLQASCAGKNRFQAKQMSVPNKL